ncbi:MULTISPECIES: ArsR/SmtB family transcription factor [Streptomyces]|uniref:ArsR/SmtB family transcription factor n=1 Tax=Streptomyces TaxID=1883 RepID=UPI0013DB377E|nr:winged helix-turn-helix domain-containing protein [Streptomyces aureoverticillatus]QIB45635.1 winged helix-turn-helix transcriptional regulator [Streptomyces aureoverticillatus]
MQRIHFTAADFARTRLKTTAGPLAETAFAYGLLGRGIGAPFARWRSQVGKRLAQRPGLLAGAGDLPDLDALLRGIERSDRAMSGDLLDAAAPVPQVPAQEAPGELSQLWKAVVAPYWDRIVAYLEAECDARGRVVMAGGVDLLLATLHSKMTWKAPVLEIHDGPDEDIHLGGRGLVLTPSVFLNHRAGRVTRMLGENSPVVLAFATPPDVQQAAALWDEPDAEESAQSLGALVGQTRAAALHVLRASCTTSQLADRLGISAAGASQHTAVLRQTGLITTRRIRNTVLHTLTPLGVALLKGMAARPATEQRTPRRRTQSAPRLRVLDAIPAQRTVRHAS